jgi:phosphoribosylamine--glycine ligase
MRLAKTENLTAAVIGKDGRTTAIRQLLERSARIKPPVACLSHGKNPIEAVFAEVFAAVQANRPDLVVIGPEEPLANGIVDKLEEIGIPCVGPNRALAELEASKAFTRRLLSTHHIPGNPDFEIFSGLSGIREYLRTLRDFVIKPDGLTGGKGVKVSGDHLESVDHGVNYCKELFDSGQKQIVIEEKLDGEEFSLQSFCDGFNVVHTVPVQDHKRALEGDKGPNTGGMGSYSDANHLLPFLDRSALEEAKEINERVARVMHYRGILFGGFMLTRNGVRLLEYNARFGDPEALNVLSVLESDFADVCLAIINGTLDKLTPTFQRRATVCKYVVPERYPSDPVKGEIIDLSAVPSESPNLKIFKAAVDEKADGKLVMSGSRAVAFVGIGEDLDEAYRHAESAAASVKGRVYYRKDIGSARLINQRIQHMDAVRHRLAV